MKRDKWTQQLHDKLADYQTPAPDDLWDDIEAALANTEAGVQGVPVEGSRKARFVTLRRWAAAAAVAAIVAGGGLVLFNNNVELREADSQLAEMMEEEEPSIITTDSNDVGAGPVPARGSKGALCVVSGQSSLPRTEASGWHEARPYTSDDEATDQEAPEQESTEKEIAENTTEHPDNLIPSRVREEEGYIDNRSTFSPPTSHSSARRSKPSLNLYAMNSLGAKDNSNAVFMADALAKYYTNTFNEANLPAARRESPIYLAGYEERQHHYQPVAFGLTFDYPLTGRLSLTSGVVYTRLRSDFTQIIRSQQISQEQTLHYVGVPLGMSYRLYQLGAFSAYVAAGVQADWNVAARQNTEGVDRHIDRDKMQWSANASLGLQYSLPLGGAGIALYAEPGISRYFDNGSPVQNFFKDKPTSMKLQMGLRLILK